MAIKSSFKKPKQFRRIKPTIKIKRICRGVDFTKGDEPTEIEKVNAIFAKEQEVKYKIDILRNPLYSLDDKMKQLSGPEYYTGKLSNGGLYKDWNFTI